MVKKKDMRKVVIAITGASGSIYADLLLKKLKTIENQWNELAIVFSDNAKEVWSTELGNNDFDNLNLPVYSKYDFSATQGTGAGQRAVTSSNLITAINSLTKRSASLA